MQSTIASSKNNSGYQRKRLLFIGFLVLSPILPYLVTMTYNRALFARTKAELRTLPSYPGAKLVESGVYGDYGSNRCLEWRLRYTTLASLDEVDSFYASALLNSGWHRSSGDKGSERYSKSTTNLLFVYATDGKFTVSLTADVFPIFQPGCAP